LQTTNKARYSREMEGERSQVTEEDTLLHEGENTTGRRVREESSSRERAGGLRLLGKKKKGARMNEGCAKPTKGVGVNRERLQHEPRRQIPEYLYSQGTWNKRGKAKKGGTKLTSVQQKKGAREKYGTR